MAEMRTDADVIQNNTDTLNNDQPRRPSNSNPAIVTPGIGFEDTMQSRKQRETASIVTDDQAQRQSVFPPISPKK